MGLKLGSVNIPAIRVTGGTTPTGTINIDENGSWDVSQFAWAEVDVPSAAFQVTVFDSGGNPTAIIPTDVNENGITCRSHGWFLAGTVVCIPMHSNDWSIYYEVSAISDVTTYFFSDYNLDLYFVMPSNDVTVTVISSS